MRRYGTGALQYNPWEHSTVSIGMCANPGVITSLIHSNRPELLEENWIGHVLIQAEIQIASIE